MTVLKLLVLIGYCVVRPLWHEAKGVSATLAKWGM